MRGDSHSSLSPGREGWTYYAPLQRVCVIIARGLWSRVLDLRQAT